MVTVIIIYEFPSPEIRRGIRVRLMIISANIQPKAYNPKLECAY